MFALIDGEWVIADRTDHTVWDRFPAFDTLLEHVLHKYLAS